MHFLSGQLQVLRLLVNSDAFENIILIDASPESVYCGSIPENVSSRNDNKGNFVSRCSEPPEWNIDLQELCNKHNKHAKYNNKLRFTHGKVTDIDLNEPGPSTATAMTVWKSPKAGVNCANGDNN